MIINSDRTINRTMYGADGADGGGASGADGNAGKADGSSANPDDKGSGRQYSAEEFKAVIAQRDEAKRKLREKAEADEKAEKDRLAKQGEFETLNKKITAELESAKADAVKAVEYRESLDKMLKAESEGLGDIADAIISNPSLSYDARMKAIRDLKARIGGAAGNGNSAGNSTASNAAKKALTEAEIMKLSSVERAKYYREQEMNK